MTILFVIASDRRERACTPKCRCFGTQAWQSPFFLRPCEIASVVPLPRNDNCDSVFYGEGKVFCPVLPYFLINPPLVMRSL